MSAYAEHFRVADITQTQPIPVIPHFDIDHPPADTWPKPMVHRGHALPVLATVVAAVFIALAMTFGWVAFAGGGLAMAAVAGPPRPRRARKPKAAAEQNAPAELDDGDHPAPVEAATEVVAVVPSPEDQAEPVTATCPLGCDWTGSFADQGRKATALALHVEHCDNAPHNKPREEGGRLAGKDDGERAKARPGADLASSPSSPQNVPEPVTPWLGGEGEGGQPADEGTRSPAPAGSDESSPVPSRPPSPIPLDELAALYAASGPGEPSLIGAPFVFHPDTDLIVLDRPTLPAPIEQLLHVPTGPDGDQPLGSMLLTPPALIDGRWTLDPYLFRADVLALMIVAQHLQERRFEGWYDPAIEQTHLRAYGLLDGQLVVVRASTHRDVASGSTCIVAEPKLAALAEAEKVELAADDFAAAHGVLAQLDAEWSQAADTLLLPASNGAVQA